MSPTALRRTSFLAMLTFLAGMATVATATGAFIAYMVGTYHAVLGIPPRDLNDLFMGANIAAFCTLAPAFATAVLWLMARGAYRESNGQLRGRGLYRTGFVAAILAGCFAAAGHSSVAQRSNSARRGLDGTSSDRSMKIETSRAENTANPRQEDLIGADWKLERTGEPGPRPDLQKEFAAAHEADFEGTSNDLYHMQGDAHGFLLRNFGGRIDLVDTKVWVQRSDFHERLASVKGSARIYLSGPVEVEYVTRWTALRRRNAGRCEIFLLGSASEPGTYSWGPHTIHVWRFP